MAIIANHQCQIHQTSEASSVHKLLSGAKPYLPGLTQTILLQKDLSYFNRFEKQMDPTKV